MDEYDLATSDYRDGKPGKSLDEYLEEDSESIYNQYIEKTEESVD